MAFDSRLNTGPVLNRPLFGWYNTGNVPANAGQTMLMRANGWLAIGINFTQPQRRVDIFDNSGSPQFRITYLKNGVKATPFPGIYTDFQTTSAGHLFINPVNTLITPVRDQPQNVGIATATPDAKLEVFTNEARLPHLRLTFDESNGVFTDFFALGNGNLRINPRFSGNPRNVGIDVNPLEKLDVQGNARFRKVLNTGPSDVLVTGVLNSTGATDDITLHTLGAGDTNQVLTVTAPGEIGWADPGTGGADNDWQASSNIGSSPITITEDIFTRGNVGIEVFEPLQRLHINQGVVTGPPIFSAPVYAFFTNNVTESIGSKEGFLVGIDKNGNGELRNNTKGKDINFYIGTLESMRIRGSAGGRGFVGINTINKPANKFPENFLEINTNDADIPGNGGLRFTDLTTNSTLDTNHFYPIPGVLSVDINGDVILVEGGGGGVDDDWFDAATNQPPTSTNTQTTIYHQGDVAVGALSPVNARFYALADQHTYAGNFENRSDTCVSVGVRGFADINSDCGIGVLGEVPGTGTGYAGFFIGQLATTTGALLPNVTFPSNNFIKQDTLRFSPGLEVIRRLKPLQYRYNGLFGFDTIETYVGVLAEELKSIDSNGVSAFVMPFDTATELNAVKLDYMLYTSINAIKQLDSAISGTKEALDTLKQKQDSIGAVTEGVAREASKETLSDQGLKKNINNIGNMLNKLMQLQPVSFNWDLNQYPWLDDPDTLYGLIAQQVEVVFPKLVFQDDSGFYHVDYHRLSTLLLAGFQEQNSVIDSLKNEIDTLNTDSIDTRLTAIEACISSLPPGLCGGNNNGGGPQFRTTGTNNTEPGKVRGTLFQNFPNPFNQSTEIKYFMPEDAQSGTLIIYDLQGKQVRLFENLDKGQGSVSLVSRELYAGMFIYTLIIDGKDVGTKRMILTE